MIQFGVSPSDTRYSFYSYDKYIRNKQMGDNALVIIDEAQNLRTQIIMQKYENPESGKKKLMLKVIKKDI